MQEHANISTVVNRTVSSERKIGAEAVRRNATAGNVLSTQRRSRFPDTLRRENSAQSRLKVGYVHVNLPRRPSFYDQ